MLYGRICSTAPSQVNQSVFSVTVSPRNNRIITSNATVMRGRWSFGLMPSISAEPPGP